MKELREHTRWWLHGVADLAFSLAIKKGYPVPCYQVWLWLGGRIDRLAAWIGGPL